MMIFRIIIWVCLALASFDLPAQSKKLIRTYGVNSMTETTVLFDKGVEERQYISFIENFDKQGNWIERKDFDKDGTVKTMEKRTYDRELLISEIKEEAAQKAKDEKPASYKHRTYTYSKGLLIDEKNWSSDGELESSKTYEYDKFGQKMLEVEWKSDGEKKKTEEFEYDKRGFRVSKVTYNAQGEITEKQVYEYE